MPITTVRDRVLDAASARERRGYRKQLRHSRKVVEFWSSTRNAICHSNTFYDGPPRDLKLGNRTVKLVRNKHIDFISFALLPLLIDALCSVANIVRTGLDPDRFKRIDSPIWLLQTAQVALDAPTS